MEKKKGLADTGEGEFILNESGTSVSIDADNENSEKNNDAEKNKSPEKHGSSGSEEKDITA